MTPLAVGNPRPDGRHSRTDRPAAPPRPPDHRLQPSRAVGAARPPRRAPRSRTVQRVRSASADPVARHPGREARALCAVAPPRRPAVRGAPHHHGPPQPQARRARVLAWLERGDAAEHDRAEPDRLRQPRRRSPPHARAYSGGPRLPAVHGVSGERDQRRPPPRGRDALRRRDETRNHPPHGHGVSLMDIVLRAIAIFTFLYILMRVVGRRELSTLEPFDLILLVVLGDAVQQGLTQDDYSLTGAFLAVGTIALLQLGVTYANFRFPRLRPFIDGEPIVILQDGKPAEKNLRLERITFEDLTAAMRLQNISSLADVQWAVMETSGSISFVKKSDS